MRKEGKDGGQGGPGSVYAAREIDDEAAARGAAEGSAERGERGAQKAGGTHALSEAVDDSVADEACGLGGDVPGGDAGSACGNYELRRGGVVFQGGGDLVEFVGERGGFYIADACCRKELEHGGAGEVGLLAARAAVADRHDDGAGVGWEGVGHIA